jgi:DNA-binding CsgD family transcriptional regulator/PAS domain-containing protein
MFDYALSAIYSAASAPELWPTALDAIAICYNSVGSVLVLSRAEGNWSSIVSPALAAAAKDYDEWGWKLDFCMARARERSIIEPDTFYTDRRLATPEEIRTHPYYTKFRTPHGLGPFLAGIILPDADVFAVLSVQGQVTRAPFTDEEIESFAGLARHIERALMLTVKLLEAEARSETFAEVLSRLSCGVFLLDDNQDIVFANKAARRMLGCALTQVSARLAVRSPQRKVIEEAISMAASNTGLSKPMVPVLLPDGGTAGVIALYVMPFGQTVPSAVRETFLAARVLILAMKHDPAQPADPLIVRDLLGLSQGEARLASLIGTGKSPREAAKQIGITEESARTVLKRVFLKTNTSRQSELAALLSRLTLKSAP